MKFFKRKTPEKNDRKSISCDVTVSGDDGLSLVRFSLDLHKNGNKWSNDEPFVTRGIDTGEAAWFEIVFHCAGGSYLMSAGPVDNYIQLNSHIMRGQKITIERFSVDFSNLVNF